MKERNNFFINKFLPILALFLLVLFTFSVNCYATDVADDEILISTKFYGDFTIPKPPDDLFYVIFTYKSNFQRYSYSYFFSYSPINISYNENSNSFINQFIASSDSPIYYNGGEVGNKDIYIGGLQGIDYEDVKTKLSSDEYKEKNSTTFGLYDSDISAVSLKVSMCTNSNLTFEYDEENNLVFQIPPQEETKVEGITIPAIQSAEEIPKKIVETVTIILPIFLAIFGVLLFLYLIKSKNLLHL